MRIPLIVKEQTLWLGLLFALGLSILASPALALSHGDARHLLSRTGFGASPHEIKALLPLNRPQAVDYLLGHSHKEALFLPQSLLADTPDGGTQEKRDLLKYWWHYEILKTPSPITERMTLFWHNHFTSSLQKVRQPSLMLQQNSLFRSHALGQFDSLLHAIAKDPAMLIYLDGLNNRKAQPNENFARELLELFTLGEGHFTESDVKAAARAFTGWSLDQNQAFIKRNKQQDSGVKTFLGYTGNFDGEDILNILLDHPRTAVFVVEKLWKAFISPQPDTQAVKQWAAYWLQNDRYNLSKLLKRMLNSNAFWMAQNRGTLIKSPVELTLGTLRSLEIQPDSEALRRITWLNRELGQDLLDPPNVKGWPGQEHWIDTRTLVIRQRFLTRISRGLEKPEGKQAKKMRQMSLSESDLPLSEWKLILLALPSLDEAVDLGDILLDPVYQVN